VSRGPIVPPGAERSYSRFQFAPAFRAGDAIYVSGVIGRDADGAVPQVATDEFDAAFHQLGEVLAAAGAGFADIVDLTTFHVDLTTLGDFMAVKARYIAEPFPAWTAIGVSGLAALGARAEVKAVAVSVREG
jgi:enamine deaminase RidA (YjgF/YER057c/UK114 family)